MDDDGRCIVASVDAIVLASIDAAVLVVLRGADLETSFIDMLFYLLRFLIMVSTYVCCRD